MTAYIYDGLRLTLARRRWRAGQCGAPRPARRSERALVARNGS